MNPIPVKRSIVGLFYEWIVGLFYEWVVNLSLSVFEWGLVCTDSNEVTWMYFTVIIHLLYYKWKNEWIRLNLLVKMWELDIIVLMYDTCLNMYNFFMYWTLYSGPITYSARVPCTLCHKKPGTDGCCSSVLRVIPCLLCLSCILRSVRHWIWYLCSTYGWTDRWGVNVCDSLLHKCFLLSDVCEWLIE